MTICLFILAVLASAPHRPATSVQPKAVGSGVSGEALLHKGAHGVVGGPAAKPSGVDGTKVRGRR